MAGQQGVRAGKAFVESVRGFSSVVYNLSRWTCLHR